MARIAITIMTMLIPMTTAIMGMSTARIATTVTNPRNLSATH